MSVENIAEGFVAVANEAMSRPIRNLTQARGFDPSVHVLSCFGGAGGQHACDVARSLGISRVFIHKYASILSAYGMALADVVRDETEPYGQEYSDKNFQDIISRLQKLMKICGDQLQKDGFSQNQITFTPYLNMRYDRTDCALMSHPHEIKSVAELKYGDFLDAFTKQYQREFGFVLPNRKIIVDDVRIRAEAKAISVDEPLIDKASTGPVVETVRFVLTDRKIQLDVMPWLVHPRLWKNGRFIWPTAPY